MNITPQQVNVNNLKGAAFLWCPLEKGSFDRHKLPLGCCRYCDKANILRRFDGEAVYQGRPKKPLIFFALYAYILLWKKTTPQRLTLSVETVILL